MKTGRKPGSERISTFKVTKEGTLFDFLQQVFKEKSKTSIKQLLFSSVINTFRKADCLPSTISMQAIFH